MINSTVCMIAKGCKSVPGLDNWKIFIDGGGIVDDFYDWWIKNRPDKLEDEDKPAEPEKKKSPFDRVKKVVKMS